MGVGTSELGCLGSNPRSTTSNPQTSFLSLCSCEKETVLAPTHPDREAVRGQWGLGTPSLLSQYSADNRPLTSPHPHIYLSPNFNFVLGAPGSLPSCCGLTVQQITEMSFQFSSAQAPKVV